MKALKLFAAVLLTALMLAAFSCSKDSDLTGGQYDEMEFRSKAVVPFSGTYSTYPLIVGADENGVLTVQIPGTGWATHLGKSEWYSDSYIHTATDTDPATPEPEFLQTGDMYFTAANGDKLFGNFTGVSIPGGPDNPFRGYGTYFITGGNGRFAGYTGEGNYHYSVNADFVGTLVWEGTLIKP